MKSVDVQMTKPVVPKIAEGSSCERREGGKLVDTIGSSAGPDRLSCGATTDGDGVLLKFHLHVTLAYLEMEHRELERSVCSLCCQG